MLNAGLAWGASAYGALAASHALLVGISGYPALPPALRLAGPANDVLLMHSALVCLGMPARDITILADQVPAAALPTRANAPQALARLTQQARAGDWVVVYLAGHGSHQPQTAQKPEKYIESVACAGCDADAHRNPGPLALLGRVGAAQAQVNHRSAANPEKCMTAAACPIGGPVNGSRWNENVLIDHAPKAGGRFSAPLRDTNNC